MFHYLVVNLFGYTCAQCPRAILVFNIRRYSDIILENRRGTDIFTFVLQLLENSVPDLIDNTEIAVQEVPPYKTPMR